MNAINKALRQQVYHKMKGHCGYCGKEISFKEMQVDHMWPQSVGIIKSELFEGEIIKRNLTNDISNLMPTCRRCNHYKRDNTVDGFRNSMLRLHERLIKNYIVKVGVDYGMMEIKPFDGVFYFERNKK